MKLQGKVISIPVNEVTEGMQIMWIAGSGNIHFGKVIRITSPDHITIQAYTTNGVVSFNPIGNRKTLVVEYYQNCTNCSDGEIEDNGPKACRSCGGNGFIDRQLPLKYKQWQSVIDNGLIDSGKTVEFEISMKGNEVDENTQPNHRYAKIIPPKKIVYTEEEQLDRLAKLLEKHNVRQHICINGFGYSQIERDIVDLFK